MLYLKLPAPHKLGCHGSRGAWTTYPGSPMLLFSEWALVDSSKPGTIDYSIAMAAVTSTPSGMAQRGLKIFV